MFVYITEFDISVDNGPGINERQFVAVLRKNHAGQVVCVAPAPAHPETFRDPGVEYVFPHRGSPVRYLGFLAAACVRVLRIRRMCRVDGLVCRLGITPILPFVLRGVLRTPV
ncbi:MAG: hypothetical protein ACRELX_19400, partial [Longimicrobiales bacterium]